MKTIILFDQDTQHYRQSIYRFFKDQFKKLGYDLVVVYDNNLNTIEEDNDFFIGIDYSFSNFKKIVKKYDCKLIIQFVWLRYKFLIPFMLWTKTRGIKIILWSHGINLQNKKQPLKNQLYYLRQKLANALIIYTPEQKKYIKTSKSKIFVANNTLDFDSLPRIEASKEDLREKYDLEKSKVILTVGRMNTNNRKIDHLIQLSRIMKKDYQIIVIGPGVDLEKQEEINQLPNIKYLGAIYDQKVVSEYYKLSDVLVMPGAIGLALNQAFYYESPVILEDVDQGPEAYYFRDKINGLYYNEGDIEDLNNRIEELLENDVNYRYYSENSKRMMEEEGSLEVMSNGFVKAINYVEKK